MHACPHNCSNRGTCDRSSNTCLCPPGGVDSDDDDAGDDGDDGDYDDEDDL